MIMMSYGYSYDYEDFVRVHRLDGFNWKGWMGDSLDLARSFYFDLSLSGRILSHNVLSILGSLFQRYSWDSFDAKQYKRVLLRSSMIP